MDEELDMCEYCESQVEDYFYDENGSFVSRCATKCPYDIFDLIGERE